MHQWNSPRAPSAVSGSLSSIVVNSEVNFCSVNRPMQTSAPENVMLTRIRNRHVCKIWCWAQKEQSSQEDERKERESWKHGNGGVRMEQEYVPGVMFMSSVLSKVHESPLWWAFNASCNPFCSYTVWWIFVSEHIWKATITDGRNFETCKHSFPSQRPRLCLNGLFVSHNLFS